MGSKGRADGEEGAGMIRRIVVFIDHTVVYLCAVQLIAMLAIIFSQVVLRYVFNDPTSWSEELTLLILIWFGYMSMALGFGHNYHIALHSLTRNLPDAAIRALQILSDVLILIIAGMMIHYGGVLVAKTAIQSMPALGISKAVLYYSLILSGGLTAFYAGIHLFRPDAFAGTSIIERLEESK
jgi:TRAP-type C4-dicarboxylate transport system permease small subunit